MNEPVGLTPQEKEVLNLTADCWNKWIELPDRVDHHDADFMRAIHEMQRILASRVAKRVNPEVWR
jgi:hypothetical protein